MYTFANLVTDRERGGTEIQYSSRSSMPSILILTAYTPNKPYCVTRLSSPPSSHVLGQPAIGVGLTIDQPNNLASSEVDKALTLVSVRRSAECDS